MQKAMELNGKKVMGQELKLDMPRSKETAQEDKKGKDLCLMRGKNLKMTQTLHFLACMSCAVLRRVMYGGKLNAVLCLRCRCVLMSAGSILNHCNTIYSCDHETFASLCLLTKTNKLCFCLSIREGYKDSVC